MNQVSKPNSQLQKSEGKPQHVLLNPPAFTHEYKVVHNEVLTQIMKSITHLNWSVPDQNTLTVLVTEVSKSIREKYKTIRVEEISTAFANGIRGEYGEFMGLSVITFEKFIIAYLASNYRTELGKSMPVAELPSPSKELTRQDRIKWAMKAFSEFRESGHYNDLGNIVYTFLDSEKLIPFTVQEKFGILEEARKQEYSRFQNPASPQEARKFNKLIEGLMTNNDTILPFSKKIALNRFFRMLIENDQELTFSNSQSSQL
jgi:hypothetical protein